MDTHQRRAGFRLNSMRSLLNLSLFEFARLINRSHYTLSAIERSLRYPSDDLLKTFIELAQQHGITVTKSWLLGEKDAPLPVTNDQFLQKRIQTEYHLEQCLVLSDDPEHRKKFAERLTLLLNNLGFSPHRFAKWIQISTNTVNQWLNGTSMPKRDTMRFILKKIEEEHIPISQPWLCFGVGALEPFQYVAPTDNIKK